LVVLDQVESDSLDVLIAAVKHEVDFTCCAFAVQRDVGKPNIVEAGYLFGRLFEGKES